MWNLNYDPNNPFYKTETDSETQRTDLWQPVGRRLGEGWHGKLELANVICQFFCIQNGHTPRFYCVTQGTVFNIPSYKPSWKRILEKNVYIYTTECTYIVCIQCMYCIVCIQYIHVYNFAMQQKLAHCKQPCKSTILQILKIKKKEANPY